MNLFGPEDESALVLCEVSEEYGLDRVWGLKQIVSGKVDLFLEDEDFRITHPELIDHITLELQAQINKRVFIILDHRSMIILHIPEDSFEGDAPCYHPIVDEKIQDQIAQAFRNYGYEVFFIEQGRKKSTGLPANSGGDLASPFERVA